MAIRLCISILLPLLFYGRCIAISDVKESLLMLKSRTLIVVLENPTNYNLKSLSPDAEAAYKQAVENYNRKIKDIIGSTWKFNAKVEFLTWEATNEIIKKNQAECLLLYAGNYSINPIMYDVLERQGLDFDQDIFSRNAARNYKWNYTAYKICKIEDFKKNKPIVTRTITNLWPLKEDIFFAVNYIHTLLQESYERNQLMSAETVASLYLNELKSHTLLIKHTLMNNALDEREIKEEYPYAFKVVENDTLLSQLSQRSNIVFIEIVPQMVSTGEALRLGYEHILMSASTGHIISYIPVNAAILHATAGNGYHHKYISKGIFSKYLESKLKVPEVIEEPKE